jgi:hypothetical protein
MKNITENTRISQEAKALEVAKALRENLRKRKTQKVNRKEIVASSVLLNSDKNTN